MTNLFNFFRADRLVTIVVLSICIFMAILVNNYPALLLTLYNTALAIVMGLLILILALSIFFEYQDNGRIDIAGSLTRSVLLGNKHREEDADPMPDDEDTRST